MVYLVYGTDLTQSRNFLGFMKSKLSNSQIKTIYANKDFTFSSFKGNIPTTSLFSENLLIIVEFEKAPALRETKHISFLENLQDTVNIVLWVGENLNKTNLLLKHAQGKRNFTTRAFNKKDSTLNFELIDLLNNKNISALTTLNKMLTKDSEASSLLTIMTSNFRNILGFKLGSNFINNLHPYVKLKTSKAAQNFSEQNILNILKKIYETDLKIKSNTRDVKSELFSLLCYVTIQKN